MISFTWDDVVALAPELADVTPAAQTEVLAQVADEVDPAIWGTAERSDRAGKWLARHLGTFHRPGAAMGSAPVSSVSAGGVSKSMVVQAGMDTLHLTKYGLEYLRMVKLFMPRFTVV